MIRVAVIGAGHWGPNLIRNFHDHRRSEVARVVDRDAIRLERIRETYPEIEVSPDPDSALDDPAVDAVVVATPTSTHHELAKKALERGKHVLVEKPVTTDAAGAEELCALAAGRGRVLMVGHVFLYNKAIQRAKKFLDDGELGHVFYLSHVRTNLGPIRVDVNAAWDLSAHDVSIANYWLDGVPEKVSATGGAWINPGVEDAVFATLRYQSGVLANLHASWLHPRKTRDIAVVGDRKMLTFDDMNVTEPLRLYDRRVTDERTTPGVADTFLSFRAEVRDGDVLIPRITTGEPLKAECDDFIECIGSGARPLSGGVEGRNVVRVLDAIQRSLRRGGAEEWV